MTNKNPIICPCCKSIIGYYLEENWFYCLSKKEDDNK